MTSSIWGIVVGVVDASIGQYEIKKQQAQNVNWLYLDDDQKADTRSKVWGISIHSSHDINYCLSNGNYHAKHYKTKSVYHF